MFSAGESPGTGRKLWWGQNWKPLLRSYRIRAAIRKMLSALVLWSRTRNNSLCLGRGGGVEGGRERKKERFHKERKEMASASSASSWIAASRPQLKQSKTGPWCLNLICKRSGLEVGVERNEKPVLACSLLKGLQPFNKRGSRV